MYELAVTAHLGVFKILTSDLIYSSQYDEMIKLQLQAMIEYERSIQKRNLKKQGVLHNEKGEEYS